MEDFSIDIENCLDKLADGGIILYPTDTIWGIGCDATNDHAVNKIFKLKNRAETKSMIILLSKKEELDKYVEHPDAKILDYLSKAMKPTTAIYKNGINVSSSLINNDGTIAIRIVNDEFCTTLINKFGKPIASTSANISKEPPPANFIEISEEIKNGVDYVVQHRQDDFKVAQPSTIIKVDNEGKITVLRN